LCDAYEVQYNSKSNKKLMAQRLAEVVIQCIAMPLTAPLNVE